MPDQPVPRHRLLGHGLPFAVHRTEPHGAAGRVVGDRPDDGQQTVRRAAMDDTAIGTLIASTTHTKRIGLVRGAADGL
ncbi:hypothetical protein, partial [Streptomyces albus]|uniref:hypothetical protein n=1 Tax=Streptomyces albus TaxID=1888 RepID=UPI0010BF5B91